jgi:hypothetical protein
MFEVCKTQVCSNKAIYKVTLDVFNSSTGCLKGKCFEVLVRLYCVIHQCGLSAGQTSLEQRPDAEICEASTCANIVEQLACHRPGCLLGDDHSVRLGFTLDVVNKKCYPGFDCLFLEGTFSHAVGQFKLDRMDLLQLTVNVRNKTSDDKSIMVREFNYLKNELDSKKCLPKHTVMRSYFCVPFLPDKDLASQALKTEKLVLKDTHKNPRTPVESVMSRTIYAIDWNNATMP